MASNRAEKGTSPAVKIVVSSTAQEAVVSVPAIHFRTAKISVSAAAATAHSDVSKVE
jgi:hypothetical protein